MNLIMMIFDIPLDQICSHLISYRPRKIPIFPKFSSPQLLLYLWILIKNLTRRYALQHPNHLSYRTSRWKTQKYMNVIRRHFHLLNLKPMVRRNLRKDFSNPVSNIFSFNPFAVFRRPYQVVFRVVNRMCRSSDYHAALISHFFCLWQTHLSSPSTGRGFQVRS
jgi:hypothetical protein